MGYAVPQSWFAGRSTGTRVKAGYTMKCNHYRYEYEVEDHGGKLRLTVKD